MSLGHATWQGRRKRVRRRLGRDLRVLGPLLGVLSCLAFAASTIVVTERMLGPRAGARAPAASIANDFADVPHVSGPGPQPASGPAAAKAPEPVDEPSARRRTGAAERGLGGAGASASERSRSARPRS